jgi:hypothetical protein
MGVSRVQSSVIGVAVILLLAGLPLLASAEGQGTAGMNMKMERYLLITTHTPEQCLKVLDEFQATSPKLLARTDWGCMAGDHTGYSIVEAESEAAARQMLPEGVRMQARVVKLNKFTPDEIRQFHTKK